MGIETSATNPELAAERRNAELVESLRRQLDKYSSDYSKNPDDLRRIIESDEKNRANKAELYDKVSEEESEHED
jgi:hypothetical protein